MSTAAERQRFSDAGTGGNMIRGDASADLSPTTERLARQEPDDQEPLEEAGATSKEHIAHQTVDGLVQEMQVDRGIAMSASQVNEIQAMQAGDSVTGHANDGREWTVTRDEQGFLLHVQEAREHTAKAPSPEMIDAIVETRVRDEAMRRSRAYFEQRVAGLPDLIGSHESEIQVLLAEVRELGDGEHLAFDHVQEGLRMPEQELGTVYAVAEAIHECRPFEDPAAALPVVERLVGEKLDPAVQMRESESLWDLGQSWYHTTSEGRVALAQIQREAREAVERELSSSRRHDTGSDAGITAQAA